MREPRLNLNLSAQEAVALAAILRTNRGRGTLASQLLTSSPTEELVRTRLRGNMSPLVDVYQRLQHALEDLTVEEWEVEVAVNGGVAHYRSLADAVEWVRSANLSDAEHVDVRIRKTPRFTWERDSLRRQAQAGGQTQGSAQAQYDAAGREETLFEARLARAQGVL